MEHKMEENIEDDIINSRKKALSNKFKIDKECKLKTNRFLFD